MKVVHADLFEQDLSGATVITLYLLPSLNVKLMPKLMKELKPGTRIVSHAFDMGDWKPEKELDVDGRKVYFWTIPKKVGTRAQARHLSRRALLAICGGTAASVAVILAVSGGFRTTVGGLRISARSPLPIALLALINGLRSGTRRRAAQQSIAADLEAAWRRIERHSHSRIVVAIALIAVAIVAAIFSTRSAAGADASGYFSQAAMLGERPPVSWLTELSDLRSRPRSVSDLAAWLARRASRRARRRRPIRRDCRC